MTKREYENVLGRVIRLDTYYMAEEMRQGYSYLNAKEKVLKEHIEEFKPTILKVFVKEETVLNILKQMKIIPEKRKIKGKQVPDYVIFEEEDGYGIYGIYNESGRLLYIGMTTRPFIKRWEEHIEKIDINKKDQQLYLYLACHKNEKIIFKSLINIKNLKVKQKINRRDIQMMELALITYLQPLCNIQGRYIDYNL